MQARHSKAPCFHPITARPTVPYPSSAHFHRNSVAEALGIPTLYLHTLSVDDTHTHTNTLKYMVKCIHASYNPVIYRLCIFLTR